MDIEDFHKRVLDDKVERNRLALEGDAILKYVAIRTARKFYPDLPAGKIHELVQPLQTNKFMISFLVCNGINIPTSLTGKEVADYFEAWIGYLYKFDSKLSINFCYHYTKTMVKPYFNLVDLTDRLTS